MPRTLYLTRNGLLEPLGQSQVMNYLRGLARDHTIILVTFEKPEDMADSAAMVRAREDCAAHGIDWRPRRFRRRPRLIAPAWSLAQMGAGALWSARSGKAELIHARSYLPAAVAWGVWRLTGTPFIFDMRALWPEELITAGRIKRGSVLHRALQRLERICLRDAAGVVSLTEAAVEHLQAQYPKELAGKRTTVIPTCADLDHFKPPAELPQERVYGCVGTVLSGWFRVDWLAALFQQAARRDPDARCEIATRDNPGRVRAAVQGGALTAERLAVYARTPADMPATVQGHAVSAMLYAGGEISELGRSPTRMGEVLGCGVPVIANVGVGDVARIVERYNVGILATDGSAAAMDATLDALDSLLADPDLSTRCRRAAEEVFSLERGVAAYRAIYRRILEGADEHPLNEPTAA
ncbi:MULTISPECIES: glycosyltransferase [unclassified Roseitalea]|uniref:glycosyltransferase n=1 Tax=unclassified Roseitalea TaxID=2639107 RepID=UPI00273E653E|nr:MULTISPECIES: glycosyltransferase [unclassified Roseitalea]